MESSAFKRYYPKLILFRNEAKLQKQWIKDLDRQMLLAGRTQKWEWRLLFCIISLCFQKYVYTLPSKSRFLRVFREGETGWRPSKVQTSSYKINKYNMINIINTTVCYIWKLLRVNPKSFHHKEKFIFLLFNFVSIWDGAH